MITKAILIGMMGILFWNGFSTVTGAREPWDAPTYWTIGYPLSLLLSALAGSLLGRSGWLAGLLIIVSQLTVVVLQSSIEPLFFVGLLYCAVLAVPAMITSLITGRISAHLAKH